MTRTARFFLGFAGALVAACLLSGCGRKGALDPPPGGYQLQPGGTTEVTSQGLPRSSSQPDFDAEGRPIAPAGPKRRSPADWLLD